MEAAVPAYGIVVEKDVAVALRDGACLKADVLRPEADGRLPAVLNLGPYPKDKLWVPPDDLEEQPNPLMNRETINPQWWVPKGYVAMRIDARGTGKSPGQTEPWSFQDHSISTMQSNGPRGNLGARARSAYAGFPISRSISGSSPITTTVTESHHSLGRFCGSLS
jgi:hypothetical protein